MLNSLGNPKGERRIWRRMGPPVTRILIIEDQLIVRDALASMLRGRPELQIVGVAASIRAGGPLLERTAPHLVLLDLSLEDGSGLELARMLYRARSETRVLVMTAFGDEFAAAEALKFGVAGYFMKDQPTSDLLAAIEIVMHGGTYMSPALAGRLSAGPSPDDDGPLAYLSRREREIFRLAVLEQGAGGAPLHQCEDGRFAPLEHRPQAGSPKDRRSRPLCGGARYCHRTRARNLARRRVIRVA